MRGQGRKHLVPNERLDEFAAIVLRERALPDTEKHKVVMREMRIKLSFAVFRTACKRAKVRQRDPALVLRRTTRGRRRMAFARKYRAHDWDRTIFTGERVFGIGYRGYGVHYRVGERPTMADLGWPEVGPSVAVWWGVCKTRRLVPVVYAPPLTSASYTAVLERGLSGPALGGYVLQHANARDHTAAETQRYLKRRRIATLPAWPSGSGNLSPLEPAWAQISDAVSTEQPQTETALKRVVLRKIGEFDQERVAELVDALPARLSAVRRKRNAPGQ